MGGVGFALVGQQVASVLDTEYSQMDPNLATAVSVVKSQVDQGFTVTQVAAASLLLPIVFAFVKMFAANQADKLDAAKHRREREAKEHDVDLEVRKARELAAIQASVTTAPAPAAPLRSVTGG